MPLDSVQGDEEGIHSGNMVGSDQDSSGFGNILGPIDFGPIENMEKDPDKDQAKCPPAIQ